eukprot:3229924-Alexandrium_andersonii.AAC.1
MGQALCRSGNPRVRLVRHGSSPAAVHLALAGIAALRLEASPAAVQRSWRRRPKGASRPARNHHSTSRPTARKRSPASP